MAMVQHHPALRRHAAPVCSVCIANFNGAKLLGHCVDSVLSQDTEVPVEIIVHDDASTDDSIELLHKHYPQVEILASRENVGFCVGNNRMVGHARGEYVLLLNNDAALFTDAIRTLLTAARAQRPRGILTLPQYDWQTGHLVDRGCLLDPFYNPVPNTAEKRNDVAYVLGACLFLPRGLWKELEGFPEWLGSLAEDMYLCCLARLRGSPVQATQGSGYRHRQGATFGGNKVEAGRLNTTYRRRALSERNKTAVMVICTPGWMVWPLLTAHVLFLVAEGFVVACFKRDMRILREIYLSAVGQLWSRRRILIAARKSAQARRMIAFRNYWRVFTPVPRKLVLLARHGLPNVNR